MARTMAMAMANQQRSNLSCEGILRWCCLSAHSDGTRLPARRLEGGMSKPAWSQEQQEPSAGILLQDGCLRPAYDSRPRRWDEDMSKPPWSPEQEFSVEILQDGCRRPTYSPPCRRPTYSPPPPPRRPTYDSDSDRPVYGPIMTPDQKFVAMGLLRPCTLDEAEYTFRSSGGIQDDDRPAHSDGTSAPRWWEVKFKKPWRLPSGIQDDLPAPQLSMVGSNSNWEGRLKRWMRGLTFCSNPSYSIQDVVINRVFIITEFFKVPEDPNDLDISYFKPEQFEYWLDEIQGYSEFMDLAHELHSIDCLFPLLHHVLVYPHAACIRAKTAELVTTMVHNNPRSQQLVMELHGLQPLWFNFTTDTDATSKTKALGAIFALIRNNKPGITAFRETNGYAALGDALSSENVWFQREVLNLIQYLLHENSSDCNTVTKLGLPRMMMHLASSDDAEVRVAALSGLLVLARDEEGTYKKNEDNEDGNSGQLVKNDVKLKQVLQELIKRISAMAPDDLVAAREEIQLVDSIWNACYNEPSSLKLFEPSPIAWAAADRKLPIEFLLG